MKMIPGKLYEVIRDFEIILADPYIQNGDIVRCNEILTRLGDVFMFVEKRKDFQQSRVFLDSIIYDFVYVYIFLDKNGRKVCPSNTDVEINSDRYLQKVEGK